MWLAQNSIISVEKEGMSKKYHYIAQTVNTEKRYPSQHSQQRNKQG